VADPIGSNEKCVEQVKAEQPRSVFPSIWDASTVTERRGPNGYSQVLLCWEFVEHGKIYLGAGKNLG
jgi:hypothetical protein